jgi:hypothetical protein
VRTRAPRHASEDEQYRQLRRQLLPGVCVVCPAMHEAERRLLAEGVTLAKPLVLVCERTATELNHRRKRSSAGALANPANVEPCCHAGNMAVEEWPEIAKEAGCVIRSDSPEWDELGARAWRLAQ